MDLGFGGSDLEMSPAIWVIITDIRILPLALSISSCILSIAREQLSSFVSKAGK
jgi:hypothetical protein